MFHLGTASNKTRYPLLTAVIFWFLMAPPAAAADPVLFATIGDYGSGSSNEADVAGLVSGWSPDFIVTMGDNRYGVQDFDTVVGQFYCNYLAGAENGNYCNDDDNPGNAFFPSLGNHDYTDGTGLDEYLSYFALPGAGVVSSDTSGSERYYDFIKGPVHFFVVDSQGALGNGDDMANQMNWLEMQLAVSASQWNIVYFHHPPYSSGSHGSNVAMQWPFAAWGADAVIAGHDHTYERIFSDGIVYFVNGLGGQSLYNFNRKKTVPDSQVRYNGDYGAMRVEADDAAITFQFINTSGELIDTYTIESGNPPLPGLLPAAPTDLTATLQITGQGKDRIVTGVELNWSDNSDNEESFVIERCGETGKGKNKTCNFTELFITAGADSTSYTDDSPGSGTYQYRVKARNSDGDSAYSSTATARI